MTAAAAPATVDYNLENDIFRLLREEPFFAAISRCVEKESTRNIPSAGVAVTDDGYYKLFYNPDWMYSLPDNHRRGILKHEFYHLILEHCGGRMDFDKNDKKLLQRHNISFDMAINCNLKGEVPEDGFFPHKLGLEEYLSAEQYYELLEQKYGKPEDGKDALAGKGNLLDDHDGWDSGDGEGEGEGQGDGTGAASRAIAKERLREAARKGAESAARSSKGWGNMSATMRERIMRFINGSVDWRSVLRNFIGNAQRANRKNSIKRINRRFPYIHPGKRTSHSAHIAIAIDQSGSVGDDLLELFFAELNGLAKMATFTVVPFDTRVDESKIFVWKKGQRVFAERVLCGGTNFDAPTEWVNDNPHIDGLIVLTDMEAPAPKPCKRRRLWMTDENGKANPFFQTDELIVAVRKMNHD